MTYVSKYSWQASYKQIAYLLVEQARKTNNLKELLSGEYRKRRQSTSCIEGFSSAGLVELAALCAAVAEDNPILDYEFRKDAQDLAEGEREREGAQWHKAAGFGHTISFSNPPVVGPKAAKCLRGAIFRNLRGDGRGWMPPVYDSAIHFLGITPPEANEVTFIQFCIALRSAVLAEVAADENFLLESAVFTESFRARALASTAEYIKH